MDIGKLKKNLTPWMRVSTWHTGHPLDNARFNRALKDAFDELGTGISFDDFKEAMDQLCQELHPGLLASYRDDIIDRLANQAEIIGGYLHDNAY